MRFPAACLVEELATRNTRHWDRFSRKLLKASTTSLIGGTRSAVRLDLLARVTGLLAKVKNSPIDTLNVGGESPKERGRNGGSSETNLDISVNKEAIGVSSINTRSVNNGDNPKDCELLANIN